jgi:hypothetical protein
MNLGFKKPSLQLMRRRRRGDSCRTPSLPPKPASASQSRQGRLACQAKGQPSCCSYGDRWGRACCELRPLKEAATSLAVLAGYSRPGGGVKAGKPSSGATAGMPRPGAAVVAGPTGTVGCAAPVGAAMFGVAWAGAAVWRPRGVPVFGIGAEDISTAGAIGAGFSAGTNSGATGAKDAAVRSRTAAMPATAIRSRATNTMSDRLGASGVVDRSILTN